MNSSDREDAEPRALNVAPTNIANLASALSNSPAVRFANSPAAQVMNSSVLRLAETFERHWALQMKGIAESAERAIQVSMAPALLRMTEMLEQISLQHTRSLTNLAATLAASPAFQLSETFNQRWALQMQGVADLVAQVSTGPTLRMTEMLDQMSAQQTRAINALVASVTTGHDSRFSEIVEQLSAEPQALVEAAENLANEVDDVALGVALRGLVHDLIKFGGVFALFWFLFVVRAVYSDGDAGDRGQTFDGVFAIAAACAAATPGFNKLAKKVAPKEEQDQ
ncbi:hypothetical protein ACWGE0_22370 [Lentzea sp. NPDC054927]